MTTTAVRAARRTGWRRASHLARRALRVEIANHHSLLRLLLRWPRVPPGAAAFTSHQPDLAILAGITVVSVRMPHGTEVVSIVHLHADDPAGFMAEARRY